MKIIPHLIVLISAFSMFGMEPENFDYICTNLPPGPISFKNDSFYFLDTKDPISLGKKMGAGGTKTAYQAGDWIVFLPTDNLDAKSWLKILKLEKSAADKIRACNKNMAQELKWIVFKNNSGEKLLTLAARSFISLALKDGLFVYDDKNPRQGLFSRFKGSPYFSGVAEEQFFSPTFWNQSIADIVNQLKLGFPKTLTNRDSINFIVKAKFEPTCELVTRAKLSKPLDDWDVTKIIRICDAKSASDTPTTELGLSGRDLEDYQEEMNFIKDSQFIDKLAKRCEFDVAHPEAALITSENIFFEPGDFFSLFVFDVGSTKDGLEMINIECEKDLSDFADSIEPLLQHAAILFFSKEQRESDQFKINMQALRKNFHDRLQKSVAAISNRSSQNQHGDGI